MYLDFTKRCFVLLQVLSFLALPVADCDEDEVEVDDSWLMVGDDDVSSSSALAEGCPPHSCARGRPWQELDDVDSAVESSESSLFLAVKIIGTSWCGVNVILVDPLDIVG